MNTPSATEAAATADRRHADVRDTRTESTPAHRRWPGQTSSRMRAVAVVRIAFGLVWAADAGLKWLPSFGASTLMHTLDDAAMGQPPAVQAWIGGWMRVVDAAPSLVALLLALAESAVAIGLVAGAFTNAVAVGGGLLSLTIWSTGEGFGGPYTNGTTDVGASLIYVFVFALLAITGAGAVWGADRRLRPRLGRLRFLSSGAGL